MFSYEIQGNIWDRKNVVGMVYNTNKLEYYYLNFAPK
jgi:hypothetical protein